MNWGLESQSAVALKWDRRPCIASGVVPALEWNSDAGIIDVRIRTHSFQNHFTCPDSFKHRNKWLARRKHQSTSGKTPKERLWEDGSQWDLRQSLGYNGVMKALLQTYRTVSQGCYSLLLLSSDKHPLCTDVAAWAFLRTSWLKHGEQSGRVFNGEI